MALPSLTCPNCRGKLEYHVTIEMLAPPLGKIDTGYCATCSQLFEFIREAGTFYESTLWPPLCRVCRQPVVFARVDAAAIDTVLFACQDHPEERWTWQRTTGRWTRAG